MFLALGLACCTLAHNARSASAQLFSRKPPDPYAASTSNETREAALKAIPLDRLEPEARAKAQQILDHVSVFRRMPLRVVACDPEIFSFAMEHPEAVVDSWQVLGLTTMDLVPTGENTYQVTDQDGSQIDMEVLYRSQDVHIIRAEGACKGAIFSGPAMGRGLLVLRNGFVREVDGRYYVTARLDAFVSVDQGTLELLTKTLQPLLGKVADTNFVQTVGFIGSLSRTAEVNPTGVQRLAGRLETTEPAARRELAEITSRVAARAAERAVASVASRPRPAGERR